MPVTVMMSCEGAHFALVIIEIPPLASAKTWANACATSRSRSSRSSDSVRRSDIDRGKSAGRAAVSGGEQDETLVAAYGAFMLLTHQRLQDDGALLDLAPQCVRRRPPSPQVRSCASNWMSSRISLLLWREPNWMS